MFNFLFGAVLWGFVGFGILAWLLNLGSERDTRRRVEKFNADPQVQYARSLFRELRDLDDKLFDTSCYTPRELAALRKQHDRLSRRAREADEQAGEIKRALGLL